MLCRFRNQNGIHRVVGGRNTAVAGLSGDGVDQLQAIMVVEDDQAIQGIVEETLAEGGYEPAIAGSGEEAITLLRGNKGKYRALVTDVNLLGKIDGWEVARVARQIDPSFPVVYMTGASADLWAINGVPNSLLLTKPFAPAQLVTAVSQLLIAGNMPGHVT
jgi:DNA-binding response OmpR family regulator